MMRKPIIHIFLSVLCLLLLMTAAQAELELKLPQSIRSFVKNDIAVTVPSDGSCTMEVLTDALPVYRAEYSVQAGTQTIAWDGLGFGGEPLQAGVYTLNLTFAGSDGMVDNCMREVILDKPEQALLYAIPSGNVLYRGSHLEWSLQLEAMNAGKIVMKVYAQDQLDKLVGTVNYTQKKGSFRARWNAKIGQRSVPAGTYRCVCYAAKNPDVTREFTVTVVDGKAPERTVGVTGPVMPSRTATDEEIWAMMIAPAVVVNNGEGSGNVVLKEPKVKSKEVGYIRGTSCAVEVIRLTDDGKWAYIGAWANDYANYIEGYVQLNRLTVMMPSQDYGVLIDKTTQQLWVFDHGVRRGPVRVSTGTRKLKQETDAGSFLTVNRQSTFASDGFRYDYAIRINGGILLHSIGYQMKKGMRTFAKEMDTLGERASHGCIRIERYKEENVGTAWWLWTHLPWNTRVIVMDNPEQRAADKGRADTPYTGAGTNGWD